jgi:hypothetical protein
MADVTFNGTPIFIDGHPIPTLPQRLRGLYVCDHDRDGGGGYCGGVHPRIADEAADEIERLQVIIRNIREQWHSYNLTNIPETEARVDATVKLVREADRPTNPPADPNGSTDSSRL